MQSAGARRNTYDDSYGDEFEGYEEEGYFTGGDGTQMETQDGFAFAQRQPTEPVQEFTRPQPQVTQPQQRQQFQRQGPQQPVPQYVPQRQIPRQAGHH